MSTDYVTKKYGGGEGAGVTPSAGQQTSEQIFEDDGERFFLHLGYLLHAYCLAHTSH